MEWPASCDANVGKSSIKTEDKKSVVDLEFEASCFIMSVTQPGVEEEPAASPHAFRLHW